VNINISIPLISNLYTSDHILFSFQQAYSPVYKLNSVSGNANISSTYTNIVYKINNSTSNSFNTSINRNLLTGTTLYLNLSTYYSSPSSGITTTLTVSVYRNGFIASTGSTIITSQPSTITSISTSVVNQAINVLTTYTITFYNTNGLNTDGMIHLFLPFEIVTNSNVNSINQVSINNFVTTFTYMNSSLNGIILTNLP